MAAQPHLEIVQFRPVPVFQSRGFVRWSRHDSSEENVVAERLSRVEVLGE